MKHKRAVPVLLFARFGGPPAVSNNLKTTMLVNLRTEPRGIRNFHLLQLWKNSLETRDANNNRVYVNFSNRRRGVLQFSAVHEETTECRNRTSFPVELFQSWRFHRLFSAVWFQNSFTQESKLNKQYWSNVVRFNNFDYFDVLSEYHALTKNFVVPTYECRLNSYCMLRVYGTYQTRP